jgi:hypothetical protein
MLFKSRACGMIVARMKGHDTMKDLSYRVANCICIGTGGTCAALEVYDVQGNAVDLSRGKDIADLEKTLASY